VPGTAAVSTRRGASRSQVRRRPADAGVV